MTKPKGGQAKASRGQPPSDAPERGAAPGDPHARKRLARCRQVLGLLAHLRWGLFLTVLIAGLPWTAFAGVPLHGFTGGMFVELAFLEVLFISCLIGVAALTIVWTQGLLLAAERREQRRLALSPVVDWFFPGARSIRPVIGITVLAMTPIVLCAGPAGGESRLAAIGLALLAACGGILAAYLIAVLAVSPVVLRHPNEADPLPGALARWIWQRLQRFRMLFGLAAWVERRLQSVLGVILRRGLFAGERIVRGHDIATMFAALSIALLFILGMAADPERHPQTPPAVYLYALLIALGWILGAVQLWLDRTRISPLVAYVLLVLLGSSLLQDRYEFEMEIAASAQRATALTPVPARQALVGDREGQPIVVVATTGGGIYAAGWTTKVLAELLKARPELWSERELRLLSGASGGSVGIAFLMDRLARPSAPPAQDFSRALDAVHRASMASSLGAVVHGIVFRDLQTLFSLGLLPADPDRGRALERIWAQNSQSETTSKDAYRPLKLSDAIAGLRGDPLAAWSPAWILNTTAMETGRRVMITPLGFAAPDATHSEQVELSLRPWEPWRRRGLTMGEYLGTLRDPGGDDPSRAVMNPKQIDMHVWTAARLSATFPYVSPAARSSAPLDPASPFLHHHFIDGGFADNSGVASAIDALWELALPLLQGDEDGPRPALPSKIAFVEIRAFPAADPGETEATSGALASMIGPALGLMNIRSGLNDVANESAMRRLQRVLKSKGIALERFVFQPSAIPSEDQPLTWHLTESQKQEIAKAWSNQPVARLIEFLGH